MKPRRAVLKAGGGVIVPRAGGGVIIPRAGGGVIVLRAGGGPIIPRSGRRQVKGGWHPDIPDFRDYVLETPEFEAPLAKAKVRLTARSALRLPPRVDNRRFCSPVDDQAELGSCTAHAVVGMLEYMMKRGIGIHTELSRIFLYKVSRHLLGWTGDTGAYIRTTIKAVAGFGVPPEEFCPYDPSRYEEEPSAFLYSYANNFKAMAYARLDPYNTVGTKVLDTVKKCLAAGFVTAFGFPVYSSMTDSPYVPYPTSKDTLQGGHAVLAVGYDDGVEVQDASGKKSAEGCLIFRNSWGDDWGDSGYGYLPYKYVEDALAEDFWTVYRSEWLSEGAFA